MKEILIYITVSVILGLSLALIMGSKYKYVSKESQPIKVEEISSTDLLLIKIHKKLLNIEKVVSNINSAH